jgi:2-dehydropantoate 2-reductase
MHVAILGAGAIGSALASSLAGETQVTLLGHPNQHLAALEREPLTVVRPDGSTTTRELAVTTAHEVVAEADLLVVAVKSYDTESAMADVAPALAAPVLTVQNGLGNVERIREFVPAEAVIGGTTTMGAFLPEPGRVRVESWGQTRIGRPWGPEDEFLSRVAASFSRAGVPTTVAEDIRDAIWEKTLFNVGINPVTALGRVQNGALQSGPGRALLEAAITEANRVARAEGHGVENPVERALDVVRATAENRSSMLRDVQAGSRTEIGALNGAIVDRAKAHDLPVPVNQTLTDAVRLTTREKAHPSNGRPL